ncbi:calcium homeostasis protein [Grosmannia clavigera kw1407]|uniref:Calcium homeostasis protein n=1 Tax=Grosmannia clavigera (strain kw1407 / UAMH 11150) TaxID=655863 RepID=F0XPR5_GROCL|nr:calcium homeostasis protein [Grosmannia clavigera kw1407]EFX00672.1 calcium homeostasis protein [Grosmannia clavigera kw1407]
MATNRQVWEVKEPYLNAHCLLGEGPFYETESNSVRFVDIRKRQLLTVDLAAGPSSLQVLQLDLAISVTADIRGVDPREQVLAGLKHGLAVLDRKTGSYEYVRKFSECANTSGDVAADAIDYNRVRGNDGAADPHGRFWLGTMTDFDLGEFQPEGALYRFDGAKSGELTQAGLTIPNAIGWSPDGSVMYFTHTTANTLYAFDYSPVDGSLSNRRALYVHPGPGSPDGFRVDVDGYIWHAIYGGSCVLKISPVDGRVVGEVRPPTPNITCTQFVGTELFITTAANKEDTPEPDVLGGALFRIDVGVKGLPPYRFHKDT